jgi:serine/threonine-protein kinase
MSRVFVATETALNRSVVIKVIAPELLEGMSVERFAREVKVAARLQQANIVPVLAAGDANGVPFYTMPFVRGESLRARIASGAPISVADAVHILRDVAQALAYAHGEGIVHRDIKPENVLLSGGAAVVTDFGIAKAIDVSRTQDGDQPGSVHITLTATGASLGTPAYMAPEQASGDPHVDHRADIYAWGLIAWELLAGRHPFAGKSSLQALIAAQMGETPAVLSSVRSDVPSALSDLIQRSLDKERSRRPASASELLSQLDQVTSGGSRVPTPVRSTTRRRVAVGIATLAAIILVALIASRRLGRSGEEKSLAIVPFTTPRGDTLAYLAEGISDEVMNELQQIGVQLAGRTSAARFIDSSAQEAGKELGYPLVLDGHVVPISADSVRVTTELTRVSDGRQLWQHSYQAPRTGIGSLQDEIARAIAVQLQFRLTDDRAERSRGTKDVVAYELYLKGLYLYRRRGATIAEAIESFKHATALDSNFARAWAALSQALITQTLYENIRVATVLPEARTAADRAVALDPKLADARAARAWVYDAAFEWQLGEAEYRTAISLDSTAIEARTRLGGSLLTLGRATDAISVLHGAVARDPLYFISRAVLGTAEVRTGDVRSGLDEQLKGLAQEPNSITCLYYLAWSYAHAGSSDSARLYAHRVVAHTPRPLAGQLGVAAYALARSGAMAEARALVDTLKALPAGTWTQWSGLAVAYAGLRDSAKVIEAMEQAEKGDGDGFPLYGSLLAGELPGGPRVEAVLRRYGLEPKRFVKRNGGR